MPSLFIVVSIYVLVGTAALAVYLAVSTNKRALKERIDDLATEARVSRRMFDLRPGESHRMGRRLLLWATKRIPSPKLGTPRVGKTVRTLMQAGYRRSSAVRTLQLLRLGCGTGLALVGGIAALLLSMPSTSFLLWIAGGGAAGAIAPDYYVGSRARKRQRAMARELSDVMDLLVVCVEAGLGLHEAIRVVGTEVGRQGAVIGRELAEVSGEMAAGSSLGVALRAFADRTAVEEIKPLAAMLIQSEQMGAQIAPALRASSEALRARPLAAGRGAGAEDHRQDPVPAGAVRAARDDDRDRGPGGHPDPAHPQPVAECPVAAGAGPAGVRCRRR